MSSSGPTIEPKFATEELPRKWKQETARIQCMVGLHWVNCTLETATPITAGLARKLPVAERTEADDSDTIRRARVARGRTHRHAARHEQAGAAGQQDALRRDLTPAVGTEAVEIPQVFARKAGLDTARWWAIRSEFNEFVWPGFDLRIVRAERRLP
jgi:hypothetical protein